MHCKPGVVYLWSLSSGWTGYRSFMLKTQKLSTGSSSFHTTSGIQYIRRLDKLILTLSDGSFHVIHNFSTEPSITPLTSDDPVTSERLSLTIRSAFVQSEQGDVDYSDVNRITGLASYDASASFIWLHEWVILFFLGRHCLTVNQSLAPSGLQLQTRREAQQHVHGFQGLGRYR